jgi:2-hydroxychromene-2-carboxylate isomerase
MRKAQFYYDVVCPYAYLASTQIFELEKRTQSHIEYCPMLLGGVFKAIGSPMTPQDTMSPSKQAHNLLDMQRWADHFGVDLQISSQHPQNTVLSMRIITAAPEELRVQVSECLFRAYWCLSVNMNNEDELVSTLAANGLGDLDLLNLAHHQATKDNLRQATDQAIAQGVFGAPTFMIDSELFWGQDRLHFVEEALTA